MARINKAFTIVELLTVMSIIILLMGLLVPALQTVRRYSLITRQHSQFHDIEIGLELYKTDFGDYPDTFKIGRTTNVESGAEILAKALIGPNALGPYYVDIDTIGAVKINQIYDVNKFPDSNATGGTYVLTDVFDRASFDGRKHGMPILYWKAHNKLFLTDIYRREENGLFFTVDQPYVDGGEIFYDAIKDKNCPLDRPKRDDYILLSAGPDGFYFTGDDIYNF